MKLRKHMISRVLPDSIAEELGLEPGDRLVSVNGQPVEDVFDYRYLMNEELVVLLVEKPDGEEWELEVEKEYEEDLGIEFENGGLMDDYRSCSNKCMFCFIDQMPPGMRETLYFKDDDSRLSFLQGNYVTLTNMSEKDIERVIRYHLEPINISFQAMNPELRCKMLHNRFAGKALDKVDTLREPAYLKTWFYCILLNEAMNHFRRTRDLIPFNEALNDQPAIALDPGERLDLYDAIGRLSFPEQTVVKLRFFEDMKLEEIAQATGANLNTVKSRLYKALKKLKDMTGEEIDHAS